MANWPLTNEYATKYIFLVKKTSLKPMLFKIKKRINNFEQIIQ
ncbi:653_t:CDS:1, partial [Gigaspora margarita]